MNPFAAGAALEISTEFYNKYYHDTAPRKLLLGINPGRHGAGRTGVPFTDSKRLESILSIDARGIRTHEPSSIFIYALIQEWGGAEAFYREFYINSPLPLGLLRITQRGTQVNANYYDTPALQRTTQPFIVSSIERYTTMPLRTDVVWCLGQGKNYSSLKKLNAEKNYFQQLIPLPHPRYIVQYKSKEMRAYIQAMAQRLTA